MFFTGLGHALYVGHHRCPTRSVATHLIHFEELVAYDKALRWGYFGLSGLGECL